MHRVLLAVAVMASVADASPFAGVVVDQATGEPVEGALIVAATTSATTSSLGTFQLDVDGNETQVLVTAPGYGMRVVDIGVTKIELAPSASEVIDVEGEVPVVPAAKPYELTAHDLRTLPGTANDALRAAQALPGVARLPYSFGGIVMRGTSPRDNIVYLDGIEVPFAFHFGGITSFYPSTMHAGIEISNGGIAADYGRAQGGMVLMRTREARADKWRTGGSVGLLDANVAAEGPIKGGSIMMGLRRSYFDIVAGPVAPEDIPLPSYWDAQVRMSFGNPTTRGRVTPLMFLSLDDVNTAQPSKDNLYEDESSLRAFFVRFAAPYQRQYRHVGLDVVPWIGTNQLQFSSRTNGVTERFERPVYVAGTRATLSHDRGWRTGIDLQGGHLSRYQAGFGHKGDKIQVTNGMSTVNWGDAAIWADARFGIGRVAAKPGVRADYYGLSNEVVVDPRLAVQEALSDTWTLRQTLGRYHQPPTPGDVDEYGGNPDLKSEYIDGATLGVERALPEGWSGSLTGFFNYGQDQGVRTLNSFGNFAGLGALGPTFELLLEKQLGLAFERDNRGRLRTYGGELLLKHSSEKWFGMLAYTLSKSERIGLTADWDAFELDQRHNLNIAGSYTLDAWRLGARMQLVSGTPLQFPLQGNLPLFFQLDVRVDRRWPQCWGDVAFYADIQNVTNRRNVEGRTYIDDTGEIKESRGLPIAPFIGIEFIPR